MAEPRLIGDIIAEIIDDLREIQQRYEADCYGKILSCKEAAAYINKTPQTISAYIAQGRLHKTSDGVKVGILLSELHKFIKE